MSRASTGRPAAWRRLIRRRSRNEEIYVDTSDKEEERGGDGRADDTADGSDGWYI
jgi:hypothetical protein